MLVPKRAFSKHRKETSSHPFKILINEQLSGKENTCTVEYTLFFIRTSNFGAEAERSYCFWQFEPEMFLRCS